MEIIEVKQKWSEEYMRIDFFVGDICNFQCWYCWPESTAAEYKWPDFDLLTKNLSGLLDYYIANTKKRKFEFCLLGGEVTHWSRFLDFITYFKTNYDCIFNLITNGSKKLDYWVKATPYLDHVLVSHHQQFSNIEHNRKLLDHFYENGVIGVTNVLMDPFRWDDCLKSIEYYKKSKHRWSIRYTELIHEKIKYTEDQKNLIKKVRARSANPFWFWKNNKLPIYRPKVVYDNLKIKRVSDADIMLRRLNYFKGWECNLGIDWLAIKINGSLSGNCGNLLYLDAKKYNIYDEDFIDKFKPKITHSICTQDGCWCNFETNMPKRKTQGIENKKFIPIMKHEA